MYVSNHAGLKNTKNNKASLYLLFKGRQSLSSLQLCQKCFLRKQLFFFPSYRFQGHLYYVDKCETNA